MPLLGKSVQLDILLKSRADTTGFDKAQKELDATMERQRRSQAEGLQASSRVLGMTGKAFIGAGAVIGGALVVSTKMAADFQEGMLGVQKTTNMTDKEIASLGDQFLTMSSKLSTSPNEMADIATIAGQLGITGERNLSEFTRAISMMTVTTEMSAEQAASGIARLGKQFKIPYTEAARMGSVLNEMENRSTATAGEIVTMGNYVAGAATQIKMSYPQVSAYGAALKDLGVSSEVGGTALSQMMLGMLRNTDRFAKAAGMSMSDFKALMIRDPNAAIMAFLKNLEKMDVFARTTAIGELGTRGVRASGVILKLVEALKGTNGELGVLPAMLEAASTAWEENTSLQKEFDVMSRGLNHRLKVLRSAISGALIRTGEQLLPVVTKVVNELGELVAKVGEFIAQNPRLIQVGVALAAIASALLIIVGVGLVVASVVLSILANIALLAGAGVTVGAILGTVATTFLWVIGIIAALITLGYVLYRAWVENWGGIRETVEDIGIILGQLWDRLVKGFTAIWPVLKGVWAFIEGFVIGFVGGLIEAGTPLFLALFDLFKELWGVISTIFEAIGEAWAMIFGPADEGQDTMKALGYAVGKVFTFILWNIRVVILIIRALIGTFRGVVRAVQAVLDAVAFLARWFGEKSVVMEDAIRSTWNFFRTAPGRAVEWVKTILIAFKDWVVGIAVQIAQPFINAWEWVRSKFAEAFAWIEGKINWIKGIFGWIGEKLGLGGGGAGEALKSPSSTPGYSIAAYQHGGVVPGALGVPRPVLVEGGETVVPTHAPSVRRHFMQGGLTITPSPTGAHAAPAGTGTGAASITVSPGAIQVSFPNVRGIDDIRPEELARKLEWALKIMERRVMTQMWESKTNPMGRTMGVSY